MSANVFLEISDAPIGTNCTSYRLVIWRLIFRDQDKSGDDEVHEPAEASQAAPSTPALRMALLGNALHPEPTANQQVSPGGASLLLPAHALLDAGRQSPRADVAVA